MDSTLIGPSLEEQLAMLRAEKQVMADACADMARINRQLTQDFVALEEAQSEVVAALANNPWTPELIQKIEAHVSPKDSGPAVEAAVLAERIRCATILLDFGGVEPCVHRVLSGYQPNKKID